MSDLSTPIDQLVDIEVERQERKRFEKQMRQEGVENFDIRDSGRYDNMVLEWHWLGWRARARAGAPS